ncbi:hypothetical protein ACX0G9_24635 [Flavitalea flava]
MDTTSAILFTIFLNMLLVLLIIGYVQQGKELKEMEREDEEIAKRNRQKQG